MSTKSENDTFDTTDDLIGQGEPKSNVTFQKRLKFLPEEVVEMQRYFGDFVAALRAEAGVVFQRDYLVPFDAPTRLEELLYLLDKIAPLTMAEFTDHQEVMLLILESLLRVYNMSRIRENAKATALDVTKFVLIGLTYGPDRALTSIEDQDALWVSLSTSGQESDESINGFLNDSRLDVTAQTEAEGALKASRNFYHAFIKGKPLEKVIDSTMFQNLSSSEIRSKTLDQTGAGVSFLDRSKPQDSSMMTREEAATTSRKTGRVSVSHSTPLSRSPWSPQAPVMSEYVCEESIIRPPDATLYASPVMETLKEHSVPLDGTEAATTLGVTYAVADSIALLTKEGREANRPALVQIPPPKITDDRRLITFNYNTQGRSVDEILGSVFLHTHFPNEAARQETKKAIFQRVIDDPNVREETKGIALAQIDQLDVTKMHTQNSYIAALRASTPYLDQDCEDDANLVPVPLLGDSPLTSGTVKGLLALMGITEKDKFSIEDPRSRPLKFYLRPLGIKISQERLSESAAYALLCSVVTGSTYDQVYAARHYEQTPFAEFWRVLQKTSNRSPSVGVFEDNIEKLLQKRPLHVEGVLTEIRNLRFKIHEAEKDPKLRAALIEKETIKDFFALVKNFYPALEASIKMAYDRRLQELNTKQKTLASFDQPLLQLSKTYILMEVICAAIAEDEDMGYNRPRLNAAVAPEKPTRARINVLCEVSEEPASTLQWRQAQINTLQQAASMQQANWRTEQPPQPRGDWSREQGRGFRHCILCNRSRHVAEKCYAYPNMEPSNIPCSICKGLHQGPCKRPPEGPFEGRPASRTSRNPRSEDEMKGVLAAMEELQRQNKVLRERIEKLSPA